MEKEASRCDDGNEGGKEGSERKERKGSGPGQTRYVTGYMGYISQIRRDAGRTEQQDRPGTWGSARPLGQTRQAVSHRDPPEVPGTCWQATEQVPLGVPLRKPSVPIGRGWTGNQASKLLS